MVSRAVALTTTIAAAALALGAGGLVACGDRGIEEDDSVRLPGRIASAEAGADADPADDGGSPTTDASVDAGGDAAPPSSNLCTPSNLVLCYPFEGEVVDKSGTDLVPATLQGVAYTSGKEGQAALLGATSAIRFAPNAVFNVPAATVEAWVKRAPAAAAADGVIFDADGRYSLTVTAAGAALCKSSGGQASGGTVPVDQWTHVACVIGGGSTRVYVDGIERASGPGGITASGLAEALGGNSPSGEPFLGAIDSFRLFSVARTAAEMAAAAK